MRFVSLGFNGLLKKRPLKSNDFEYFFEKFYFENKSLKTKNVCKITEHAPLIKKKMI